MNRLLKWVAAFLLLAPVAALGQSYTGSFTQSGAGAVNRTWLSKAQDLKTVADFGVVGYAPVGTDCSVNAATAPDDTAALRIAANLGYPVRLIPNTCYKITASVEITVSGSGLIGDRSSTIWMPAANFNSTTLCSFTNCLTSNALGLYVHGDLATPFDPVADVVLDGFRVISEVSDGRAVGAVAFRNAKNVIGDDLEISGFPVSTAFTVDSVTGASEFDGNYVHDFYSNATWATQPQSTGIAVDNNRVNSVNSDALHIQDNHIADLTLGPVPLGTWGMQTDGINPQAGSFFVITNNKISNVGEAIDNWASSSVIADNDISNTYNSGLKTCHGGSYNLYTANNIYQAGEYGIVLCGDSGTQTDTADNSYIANRISFLDQNSVWSASVTACIRLEGNGASHLPVGNVFKSNDCNASGAQYGIFGSSDDGTGNSFLANSIINASVASVSVPANVGTFANLTVGALTAGDLVSATKTAAGAVSIPLALTNASGTAGTQACIDVAPSTVGIGVRSGQLCFSNDGGNIISFAVNLSDGAAPGPLFTVPGAPSGAITLGRDLAVTNAPGTPTLSSCGTSPSVTAGSSDTAGQITTGTGSPTGCILNFVSTKPAAPFCIVKWQTNLASMSYTVSASAISMTQTGTSSNKITYHCIRGS